MTVAIITAGYDGTVDETQLAEMFYRYSVLGPEDFKATTQAGDRILAIADGVALGPATRDVATALPNIQFVAAAAGTTRWDMVALRRDWQPPGGTSAIVIIQGPAAKGYPAEGTATNQWNRRPGIMDDQPLYLQEVIGTSLGQRIDLRCWAGHGGLVAASTDAKAYLERPGAEVLIGTDRWTYTVDNGVAGWVKASAPQLVQGRAVTVPIASGANSGSLAVTFPTPFTATPAVSLTKAHVSGSASSLRRLMPVITNVTATGFTATVETVDGTGVGAAFNVACHYTAVQTN